MFATLKHFAIVMGAYAPGAPAFDGLRPEALDRPLQQMHDALHGVLTDGYAMVDRFVSNPQNVPGLGNIIEAFSQVV
ncbi:MAG: hypothetical protein AAF321_01815 [Pseudomonadota bacterium]